jgi:protease IV
MRVDRLLAIILIVICFTAAVGNWLVGSAPFQASNRGKSSVDIALIDIYGGISDTASTSPFGASGGASANALLEAIGEARKDKVKAILLRINSPGGTAAAAQSVYHELMRTRKETDIKIVASLGDLAASGGYYIASAAHHIVANPSTLTGSIGVIVQTQNVAPFLDKLGVQAGSVQSGQYKDILSPFRSTTEGDRKIIQGIVSDSYEQFLASIVEGRNIPLAELRPLADGRIYTGAQAKAVKLVDSLGNYQDAVKKTAELTRIKGEPKIRNYSSKSLSGSLLGRLLPFSAFSASSLAPLESKGFSVEYRDKVPMALME